MPRDDLETLARILEDVEQRLEDGTIAIRYLENVVNHPDEPKYRKINKANRRFSSEVWLQPGIRTAFLASGFREDREARAKDCSSYEALLLWNQEDGTAVLLLDPLTDHGKRCAEFTLHRLKNIRARRLRGGGVTGAAAAAPAASHPDAGTEPRPREARRPGGHGSGTMTCEACGKNPLLEDTHSNRPDVLYRSQRPNFAVTCKVCKGFFICGDCFNRQSYQHAPDHQLVLYAREARLAEQSPWPRRHRGKMPPPPGPGSGGRPRRGPWG
ncbi:unnamed protein product [Ectocarpus sp. 4 AP-2014]